MTHFPLAVSRLVPLFLVALGGALGCSCQGEQPVQTVLRDADSSSVDASGAAVTLASPGGDFVRLDATSVYWNAIGKGLIGKVAKAGGPMTELVPRVTFQDAPTRLAIDKTYVYWTDSGHQDVRRVAIAGGAVEVIASRQDDPYGIAVNATHLYWTVGSTTTGRVLRIPIAGGEVQTVASGLVVPTDLALDSQGVYVATDGPSSGDASVARTSGSIVKVPLEGGEPISIATGLGTPRCLEPRAGYIYWVNVGDFFKDGSVMRAPIGGGMADTLVSGITGGGCMAVDDAYAYWTVSDNSPGALGTKGAVFRVPVARGPTSLVVTGLSDVLGVAVDATNVYWAEGGRIGKVAKEGQ